MAQTFPFARGSGSDLSPGQKLQSAAYNTTDKNAAQAADGLVWSDLALVKNFQKAITVGGGTGCLFWDAYLKRWINGYNSATDTPAAKYSFDGKDDWIAMTAPTLGTNWGNTASGASNGAGTIVLGGGGGVPTASLIRQSADGGATWNARSLTTSSGQVNGLIYNSGSALFIAAVSNTAATNIETSPDGITWTQRTGLPNTNGRGSIAVNQASAVTIVLSLLAASTALRSVDGGTSWASVTLPSSAVWSGVTYSVQLAKFFAIGNSVIASSADGITWSTSGTSSSLTAPFTTGNKIVSFGRLLIATGVTALTNAVAVSLDGGVNWTSVKSSASAFIDLGFGDSQIAALASNAVHASLRGGL